MPFKRKRKQQNVARTAFIEFFKKRRLKASSFFTSVQLDTDNNKLSTTDINNEKAESGTYFWNKSANKTNSDFEEEGYDDVDVDDLEEE